jgi:tRNA dimethylallyltransferase
MVGRGAEDQESRLALSEAEGGAGERGALVVIVGQTAVGKTALSLQLAAELNGEIISADSRLFYRGLDIGTAKPTPAERALVAHHLIDICQPDEIVTLGEYQRLAYAAIDDVLARGKQPLLVGGTGQYVMAVIEGWGIPKVPPQPRLRRALARLGAEEVARWLSELDAEAASKIDPRNTRRMIRALEVTVVSGQRISELQHKIPPPYGICMIGLSRERGLLYEQIDARVEAMMAAGFLDEVKQLYQAGYSRHLPAISGLGYRQLYAYFDGEISLDEAVDRIKFETHRLARQQATWFRPYDTRIHWFDLGQAGTTKDAAAFVHSWLASRP